MSGIELFFYLVTHRPIFILSNAIVQNLTLGHPTHGKTNFRVKLNNFAFFLHELPGGNL